MKKSKNKLVKIPKKVYQEIEEVIQVDKSKARNVRNIKTVKRLMSKTDKLFN